MLIQELQAEAKVQKKMEKARVEAERLKDEASQLKKERAGRERAKTETRERVLSRDGLDGDSGLAEEKIRQAENKEQKKINRLEREKAEAARLKAEAIAMKKQREARAAKAKEGTRARSDSRGSAQGRCVAEVKTDHEATQSHKSRQSEDNLIQRNEKGKAESDELKAEAVRLKKEREARALKKAGGDPFFAGGISRERSQTTDSSMFNKGATERRKKDSTMAMQALHLD